MGDSNELIEYKLVELTELAKQIREKQNEHDVEIAVIKASSATRARTVAMTVSVTVTVLGIIANILIKVL